MIAKVHDKFQFSHRYIKNQKKILTLPFVRVKIFIKHIVMERDNTYENPFRNVERQSMDVGNWFLTLFLQSIPIVGIVMLFVWAFGKDQNTERSSYAKAFLAWYGIITVFALLGIGVWITALNTMDLW